MTIHICFKGKLNGINWNRFKVGFGFNQTQFQPKQSKKVVLYQQKNAGKPRRLEKINVDLSR
jgi:hypothetical protein